MTFIIKNKDGSVDNRIVADEDFVKLILKDGQYFEEEKFNQRIPTLEETKKSKLQSFSQTCNQTIISGCDVTLTDGTKGHISMTEEDQINLSSALSKVKSGATGAPYHLDGNNLCKIFSAEDIVIMATMAEKHITYHRTYFNHLKFWINRLTTIEEVNAITYGSTLPEDLAKNMTEVLAHV